MVRRVFAIALVGTSLVVAACGSNDDSPESARTATGTTGATGPTANIPPISELPDGSDGERGSGSSGSSSGSDGAPAGDGNSGKGRSRKDNQRRRRTPGASPGPTAGGTPSGPGGAAPIVRSDEAAYRVAKEICANVTLEGIAINLRINLKERDDRFVARAFSRGYPSGNRDAAYRGCLEGFRNPVKP